MKRFMYAGLIVFTYTVVSVTAREQVAYQTYIYDEPLESFVESQAAFVPVEVFGSSLVYEVDGERTFLSLDDPSDIAVDGNGNVVIVDTGNDRIVRTDSEGVVNLVIDGTRGERYELNRPTGVHVASDGTMYVADTRNGRIAIFEPDGTYRSSIGKPDDPRIAEINFRPAKVSRDARGFYFVVLQGGNEGMLVLSPDGRFQGFFGANRVQLNPIQRVQRLFFTEAQLQQLVTRLSPSPTNVAVGSDRLIYMVTSAAESGQIRKFNTAALDLFDRQDFPALGEGPLVLGDIAIDADGNIYAIDVRSGVIYMYDNNGELTFAFGSLNDTGGTVQGLYENPVGIEVDDNGNLYVVDRTEGNVHILRPTRFAEAVKAATDLMSDGRHGEAAPLWRSVLDMNVNFQRAYQGIGMAYYNEEDYDNAALFFRRALDQERFSLAWFQIRLLWVQQYFGVIASSITVLLFAFIIRGGARSRKTSTARNGSAIREDYT
ncbi:MAG: hypothetical protein ACOC4I_05745 [Spirochaetota bacterium]